MIAQLEDQSNRWILSDTFAEQSRIAVIRESLSRLSIDRTQAMGLDEQFITNLNEVQPTIFKDTCRAIATRIYPNAVKLGLSIGCTTCNFTLPCHCVVNNQMWRVLNVNKPPLTP